MLLYIGFSLVALFELYFFAMQRSILEISRVNEIDPRQGRLMLPLWYTLVWPLKLGKYYLAYVIYTEVGIVAALVALSLPFIISTFMPIPHKHFIPLFINKISVNDGTINPLEYVTLKSALKRAQVEIQRKPNA